MSIPMKIQRKIAAWLSANHITASDVPVEVVPTIRDGRITCPVYLRRGGSRYLDENRAPARGSVDVPLLVEATDGDVRRWLAGKVSA